ncbi:MAG: D-alanyl-D-alanine carboxypeptidase family protein [Verrucomicrobia bacterium]|nr:D-alanyl-D-alanine carboxypeptidase family protein [Verrucomicrobiota bacterium]
MSEAEVLLESEAATPVTPVAIENRGGGRTEDQREVCSDELETIAGVNERLVQLHRVAAAAWRAMVAAARADGLSEPLLLPISGHRTTLRQAELFRAAIQRYGSEREARRWVAPPGGSAHHTGRAMDLYLGGANTRANVAKLCSLPAWQWMRDNAARFGFYADDREPWHWEYNPPMQAAARAAEDKPEAAPEELEAGEFEDEGSTGGEGNLLETEAEAEFNLVAVENPGGGRIQDKRDPPASSLETVAGPGGDPVELHHLAAAAWRAMVAAARREGISSPMLLPTSGYRSREHQARLFADAVKKHGSEQEAGRWVARPGHSAHQSGRAIDLHLGGRNASANAEALRGLPAYQWLSRNAARFGFYPYPREPWHWEYNPPTKGSGTVASNPAQQSSESTPPLPYHPAGLPNWHGLSNRYSTPRRARN